MLKIPSTTLPALKTVLLLIEKEGYSRAFQAMVGNHIFL